MDTFTSVGPLSRRTFLKGALVGSAVVASGGIAVGTAPSALASDQSKWRWCSRCQGLWYSGNGTGGRCPSDANTGHTLAGSGNYVLDYGVDVGQDDWRWCSKCQGLGYAGNGTEGKCPAGGGHAFAGSGNYSLRYNSNVGQNNWRWCSKCQGLWYAGNGTGGRCPSGTGHTSAGSGNYSLRYA
jgi:hypothetical protein